MARQRINALAKYRLERVLSELKSIQAESKFKKLDTWNLEQATEMIGQVVSPDKGKAGDAVGKEI